MDEVSNGCGPWDAQHILAALVGPEPVVALVVAAYIIAERMVVEHMLAEHMVADIAVTAMAAAHLRQLEGNQLQLSSVGSKKGKQAC